MVSTQVELRTKTKTQKSGGETKGECTVLRPLSVDSLNGGSTDALKKAPVEKKLVNKIVLSYLCFY